MKIRSLFLTFSFLVAGVLSAQTTPPPTTTHDGSQQSGSNDRTPTSNPPTQRDIDRQPPSTTANPAKNPTPTAARGNFDAMDTNHDGYLSTNELAADTSQKRSMSMYDTDGDGRVSRDEWTRKNPASRDDNPQARK